MWFGIGQMCLEKNMIRIPTCLIIMHMVCSTVQVYFFFFIRKKLQKYLWCLYITKLLFANSVSPISFPIYSPSLFLTLRFTVLLKPRGLLQVLLLKWSLLVDHSWGWWQWSWISSISPQSVWQWICGVKTL